MKGVGKTGELGHICNLEKQEFEVSMGVGVEGDDVRVGGVYCTG